MKTVLVTGGAGFIGSYVSTEFVRAGWEVLGLDVVPAAAVPSIKGRRYQQLSLPSEDFAALLRSEKPSACVHCAGSASVPCSLEEPYSDFHSNTVLTGAMLEALRQFAPECHFLLLSSAAVYGDPVSLPVRESDAVAPLSPYGFHKRQAEMLCQEYSQLFAVPTTVVRIFSAYGVGLRRQVIWDICRKALHHQPVQLHGTGRESRDFIHASDIGRALALLASQPKPRAEIYNLACGEEVTIAELAARLFGLLGRVDQPEFTGVNPSGNPLRWSADVSRLKALGFVPAVSLEAGVTACVMG